MSLSRTPQFMDRVHWVGPNWNHYWIARRKPFSACTAGGSAIGKRSELLHSRHLVNLPAAARSLRPLERTSLLEAGLSATWMEFHECNLSDSDCAVSCLFLEIVRKTHAQIGFQRNADNTLERFRLIREGQHLGGLAGIAISDQEISGDGHVTKTNRTVNAQAALLKFAPRPSR